MRVFRVNLRCWISSFVLPLIRDLFVMVLSETLKRAVKGIAAVLAALKAAAVSISITLQPMAVISSMWANWAKMVSMLKVLPLCRGMLLIWQMWRACLQRMFCSWGSGYCFQRLRRKRDISLGALIKS